MQSQQTATSQNLHALLPSYNRPSFPPELVSLSQSLHALSRSRASTLKPDEEIARGFVCCHLACERLKQRLNLPTIVARPPCGPRIYKKLYQFIDKALPEQMPTTPRKSATSYDAMASTPIRTPNMRTPANAAVATPPDAYVDARSQPATPTPLRNSMVPMSAMPERKKRRMDEGGDILASLKKRSDAPEWLHGTTQYLAKKFGCPPAASHVYQGVCDISKNKRYGEEEMTSLVVAVLLTVLSKMGRLQDVEGSYMRGVTEMVALKRVKITRMGAVVTDVEKWIEEEAERWTAMAWFEAVPVSWEETALDPQLLEIATQPVVSQDVSDDELLREDTTPRPVQQAQARQQPSTETKSQPQPQLVSEVEAQHDDQEMEDADFDEHLEVEEPIALQPREKRARIGATRGGLGTMTQSANDWLSEERRADYAKWKVQIMRKIEAVERRQQTASA